MKHNNLSFANCKLPIAICLLLIANYILPIASFAQYTLLTDFTGNGAFTGKRPMRDQNLVSDGTFLYGMTSQGGANNQGNIFKIMPDGSGYVKLLDFSTFQNGRNPYGSLIFDGTFLYGMTSGGGASNKGTIFKIQTDGSGYSELLEFTGTANGSKPYGSLISDGTFLYGMTYEGGASNKGTIFKIQTDGSVYSKLLDFTGTANGSRPYGSLISDGTFLYGMTSEGGANSSGSIFKIMPDGSGYVKLLDFSTFLNGSKPHGSLIYDGTFLYGMTSAGGTNDLGTIFKIQPDGNGYTRLLEFDGAVNGSSPYGSLIFDGTFLHGMTYAGGTNDLGIIFRIQSDGSGYTKLLEFDGAVNGSNPYGSLISEGTFLYGMTAGGGANSDGTIFKIMSDGSGYARLLEFDGDGAVNGSKPYGSLISDGTFLYGMTSQGGANSDGTIFKIMPDGSGYTKLFDFSRISNGAGAYPYGSLISDGTFLYGMTSFGGTNDLGTIFKIQPDGNGYSKLLDFTGTANGSRPYGSLISDGTFLYGMTSGGGTNDNGTIFKIMPDGSGYTKLSDFSGTADGAMPHGSLFSDGTFLYGMTFRGGTNSIGTIFKIMPDGSGYSKLFDFSGTSNGKTPYGSLISDGTFLYGMTYEGGANSDGTIFKIMPDGNGYTKLFDFDFVVASGLRPFGSLIFDGTFLYGMTSSYHGNIFKIMPDGSGFTTLLDFAGTANGRVPYYGSLFSDGTFLYGTTSGGGTAGAGTVFRFGCPEITLSPDTTVCYDTPRHLFALTTPPDFYPLTWSPATGLSSTTGGAVDAVPNVGISTYTISGTNNNGCSVTRTLTIDVKPLPTLTGTENISVCFGTSATLGVTGAVTYSWNPQVYLSSATDSNVTLSQAPEGSTQTYTITGYDELGCSGTHTLSVTINTLPTVNAGFDQMLCSGIPASLSAIGTQGNYTWSPGTYFISNTGANVSTNVTATAGTYTCSVYLQDKHNCITTDTVLINVTTTPTATITTTGETSICSGKKIPLFATSTLQGLGYLWNTGNTSQNINAIPLTKTTYSVVLSNGNCKDTAAIDINVTTTPTLMLTANRSIICSGESVALSATGAGDYLWSTGESGTSITASPPLAYSLFTIRYSLKLSNGNCFDSDSILITIVPTPTASIIGSLTVCSGNSTGLTAMGGSTYLWSKGETSAEINTTPLINTAYSVSVSNGNGLCTDTTSRSITLITPVPADAGPDITIAIGLDTVLSANDGSAWSWSPKVRMDCSTCQNPIVAPFQTTSYTVTVTDINGCLSYDSVKVHVIPCAELFVPKAFSPNNDGQNDVLYIRGTDCIDKINAFTIFNRWGEKVFESLDIKTGWDGSQTKASLPNEVFIYYLDALSINGDAVSKTGNVTLLK